MSGKIATNQQQEVAEAHVWEFEQALGPFVVAAETTRMPMIFLNAQVADKPIVFVNDSFVKLIGFSREELLAKGFNFVLASSDAEAMRTIDLAFTHPSNDDLEIHYRRKDGSVGLGTLFVSPVEDADGKVVQHFVSLLDTTRFQTAQKQSAMLIDELNHRVKNTLAMVQSIVTQALRNSPVSPVVRESVESRITALARSHDLLSRENWDGAGLRDLIDEALAPFGIAEGHTDQFTIQGQNLKLLPEAALALGIAVNELATNAVKYGALANETGRVSLEWTLEEQPDARWLCLQWSEKDGPVVSLPPHKGFGSWVIQEGLAHELAGKVKLDYPPSGLVCTIRIPASRVLADG